MTTTGSAAGWERDLTLAVIYHIDTGASLQPLVEDMVANAKGGWTEPEIRGRISSMLDEGLITDCAVGPGRSYLKVTEPGWDRWRAQWATN